MGASEINKYLEKWINTPKGKAVVAKARKDAQREGRQFGSISYGSGSSGSGSGSGSGLGSGGGVGNIGFGTGTGPTAELVNKIIQEIVFAVHDEFPKMPSNADGMFRIYTMPAKNGEIEFRLFFIPWVVHRESLYPEGHPEGMRNIVEMRSHGSKPTEKAVWNKAAFEWDYRYRPGKPRLYPRLHGEYREGQHYFIKEGTFVDPNPFLIDAIEELNMRYKNDGVRIVLDPKYFPE